MREAAAAALRTYYARRAATYERIYRRAERQTDLRAIEAGLGAPFAGRRVLEIACGTGWWTPHGARECRHWLATDVNDETLEIARAKPLSAGKVAFAHVDAWTFDGLPDEPFDAAFAGHWWSHVPLARLPHWLAALHARLQPGARVVMLDNRYVAGSSTPIARRDADGNTWQRRRLDDGSTHEVLKNFPTREQALAVLAGIDGVDPDTARWTGHVHYWVLDYELAPAPARR